MHSRCVFLYGEKGINYRINLCLSFLLGGERWIPAKNSSTAEKQDFDKNLHGSSLHLCVSSLDAVGTETVPTCALCSHLRTWEREIF